MIFEPLSPRMPKRDSDCFIRRVSIVFSQSFKRGVSVTEIANDYVTLIHNYWTVGYELTEHAGFLLLLLSYDFNLRKQSSEFFHRLHDSRC